ncbi:MULTISPECIES: DUF4382 domain-containing protein [Kosmotoga]|jgi:hypothetical protein|uniref:DUF4382 domain-containing protein n=1 Tax=Kosmotoga olearia (strain ATCC BAA-1733 / DSM 21960 / TBF 19.5.1) TaxID=521045 RepID=C5CE21_KOSOT|nr:MULTISPECIES: DUF4382 domain-containing protein [Kosmotoga]ACR80123.1 hypothetical protein Kole_1431 [Kosmotoga olearia TBF 19.5.1]OAA20314.1 hypothetical protein DU53_07915 [Kosmotoga sp. DU53]
MKKITVLLLVAITTLFAITGCVNWINDFEDEEEVGTLQVFLTDAVVPINDIERLEVQIDEIVLIGSDASPTELVISDESTVVNLLDLVGEDIDLGTVEGTGTYDQLRFYVGDVATITVLGVEYPIEVVAGKLICPLEGLDISETDVLLLDFDLSRSLIVQGRWDPENVDNVHMTPVIHSRHGDDLYDVTGIITTPSATPFLVTLNPVDDTEEATALLSMPGEDEDENEVLATFTHKECTKWEEGEFKFKKVEDGKYMLYVYDYSVYSQEDFDVAASTTEAIFVYPEIIEVNGEDIDLGEINAE